MVRWADAAQMKAKMSRFQTPDCAKRGFEEPAYIVRT